MSFNRTKNSIDNLSNKETITLDLMFDMMVCVVQDVMRYNNTADLSETPIADKALLLKKVCNIMQMTVSAYEKNKDGMAEFGNSIQNKYSKLVEQLKAQQIELEKTGVEVEAAEKKQAEFQSLKDKLEKERGHLLSVNEQCEDLQRQIDILSDPALEKKAQEKEKLTKDLTQRQSISTKLDQDIKEFVENITELDKKIKEQEKEKNSKTDEKKSLDIEKTDKEKELEELRIKLKECKDWIENYPEMSKQIQDEYVEERDKITVMINAFNSIMSEEFLRKTLFKTDSASEKLSVKEHPDFEIVKSEISNIDDLQLWFNNLEERINGLIEIYGTMLKSLVDQTDILTRESK